MRRIYCTGIDKKYYRVCEGLKKEPQLDLLKVMAEAGAKGVGPYAASSTVFAELGKRDSNSTLVRLVTENDVRIHRYSHALYLQGVTEPTDEKATENIEKVKKQFGMNDKAKSA